MHNIFIALLIGVVAGIINVLPMVLKKLDKYSNLSAFIHWVVLGLIIPFVDWGIAPWLKGLILGELLALPVMILLYPKDKTALLPITISSALLGMGIAISGAAFIH